MRHSNYVTRPPRRWEKWEDQANKVHASDAESDGSEDEGGKSSFSFHGTMGRNVSHNRSVKSIVDAFHSPLRRRDSSEDCASAADTPGVGAAASSPDALSNKASVETKISDAKSAMKRGSLEVQEIIARERDQARHGKPLYTLISKP